jgi:hypothetical protein
LGYLLAQGIIVAGLLTPRFNDSAGYMDLSFVGKAVVLWTVPLLYRIFPTDPTRMAAQVVLAACCWWVLANAAAQLVQNARVRLGLRVTLLALGLVGPIASWNSTILSESTAISLTALLIGCWIRYWRSPSWLSMSPVLAVTLFWTCTRNDFVLIGLVITVIAAVTTLWRGRSLLKIVLAAGLIVISTYDLVIVNVNLHATNVTVAGIIQDRVLENPDWTRWFIAHGMPYSAAIQDTEGGIYGTAIMAIPSFESWLTQKGAKTYLKFMLEHPEYTLWAPLPSFSGEEASVQWPNRSLYPLTVHPNPTPSMLSPDANYGRHRDVLPAVVQGLLFEQGQAGDVLLLAFAAFGFAWAARGKFGRDRRMLIPVIVTLLVIPEGYLVWLTGGDGELDRHSISMAVAVRIGLWIILALALDRFLEARRSTPSEPEVVGPLA